MLAIGWLAEGNLAEAQRAIARADKRLRITEDRLIRLSGGIAAARVRAAVSGSTAEARRELDALSREADGLSAVALAFEARLALGEIEMRTGDASTGRARLTALEREAAAKGFVSLARRAAAAAR
ncbi:MAG TPA: hypothetical protein VLD67_10180 [Vicinamibacterales bacterium]|nr:hypothetical protein [Vicinamibacterales bacterium]